MKEEIDSSLNVCRAGEEDLDFICFLFDLAKSNMLDSNIFQWTTEYPNQSIIEQDIKDRRLIKLCSERKILCVASIYQLTNNDFQLNRIVVNPENSNRGYATLLLNEICFEIKNKKGKRLFSSTNHTNKAMQMFFKKNHFIKVEDYVEQERQHLGLFYKYLKII